jgi:hypothetical protein
MRDHAERFGVIVQGPKEKEVENLESNVSSGRAAGFTVAGPSKGPDRNRRNQHLYGFLNRRISNNE